MSPVLSPPMTGSFSGLMTALYAAQQEVGSCPILNGLEPLTFYRWRDDAPDAPACWNVLNDEPSAQADTARRTDSFVIETRIGVNLKDADERLEELELYVDAYRYVMDPIFRREAAGQGALLGGAARWAERQGLRWFSEEFGGAVLSGVAFIQRFDVDRIVLPQT